MKYVLRAAAWSLVIAPLCWAIAPFWGMALLPVINRIVAAVLGAEHQFTALRFAAPWDIGLFVAMTLAFASPTRRLRAFAVGIPAMIVAEIVLAVGGAAIELAGRGHGSLQETTHRLNMLLIHTVPWVTGPLAWILLAGPPEAVTPRRDEVMAGR